MREVSVQRLRALVERMCIQACYQLPQDVCAAMERAEQEEPWPPAQRILHTLRENAAVAVQQQTPICQDTGMACVFLRIGQQVYWTEGDLQQAVQQGVRDGYAKGYLRKSVVADPLRRVNTQDNTPALIYTDIVPGSEVEITVAPKGFGSENMSRLAMLKPADGAEGVKRFVMETVELAGSNPCPPIVVGVGIGGSFDRVALLAKQALLRPIGTCNEDPFYQRMEQELLEKINQLGVGPQGFGGKATALAVHIVPHATHIAGLPVAVNINCHVSRHVHAVL